LNGPIEIPNKSSFKINEVCALTGVKSYVLRFWESEFPEISPFISSSGVKLYEHRDIEAILMIKKLLFEDKLSIEKAKGIVSTKLPKNNLIDDAFREVLEHEQSVPSNDLNLREPNTKRILIDSEFQKLILAKNKLGDLIKKAESLERFHHWV
jgi:DNA-binding transcriptional MerR regulator